MSSIGSLSKCPAHRSFFRERLLRLAGARPLEDWLLEEANARGHFGAVGRDAVTRSPTAGLDDDELIVALLMPHSEADARLLKLIVRMLQKARLDPSRLWLRARRERADVALWWLLERVPASERTGTIPDLLTAGAPRGFRGLSYDYDARRLIKKPATAEALWIKARRSS